MTLMTFDVERGVYRNWSFLATGSVIENEGVWNPEERSFVWGHQVMETAENVITKAVFEEDGAQAWSIVKTGADGRILREVTGRSRRKSVPTLQAA
jgi:hypothetical protein